MKYTPEKYEWLTVKMAEILEKYADTPGTGRKERRRLIYDVAVHHHGADRIGSWGMYEQDSHRYWTLGRCKADALQYETRTAWRDASPGAYRAAINNGWLDLCCGHMREVKKPRGHWTPETCKADARKYGSRSEWRQSRSGGYHAADRRGIVDQCCEHMGTKEAHPWGYWTLETCKADALQYETRKQWCNASGGYQAACKNDWLDLCCAHMEDVKRPVGYWTLKHCMADAMQYGTRGEWRKGNGSAYDAARRNGWLDQCCGHMPDARTEVRWNLEICKKDALRFETRNAWQKGSISAYNAAQRNGWLDLCCGHMKSRFVWTLEICKADALKHGTRGEWQKANRNAYKVALQKGWLDQCCEHMTWAGAWTSTQKPRGYWTLARCKADALRYRTRTEWNKQSSGAQHAAERNGWLDLCCEHMNTRTKKKPHSEESGFLQPST